MKALFLIQGFHVPSSRYRVLQFLPYWQEQGHSYEIIEHSEVSKNKDRFFELCQKADIVFFHRKRYPSRFIKGIKKQGPRLVYDVDDAVMYRDALKPGKSVSWLRQLRYKKMTSQMDQVIVGNSFIASKTNISKENLSILPTCLNLEKYPSHILEECSQPTLVWIGDGGSLHYLEKMRPILEEVGKRVPNCRLKIICNHFFDLENMDVLKVPWSAENEISELSDSQIGLMPLGTDPWSQGKCALKFLQYMVVGRPSVVTPVGMNADLLEAAPCGIGATSEEEWIASLIQLLQDAQKRKKMGEAGFQLVRKQFSLQARAKEWVELVSG